MEAIRAFQAFHSSGHKFKSKLCSTPHADSGFAAIPPMRPAAVSKKAAISGPEHPVTGSPVESENSALLAIPGPTVVECMLIVGLIVSDWGCEVSLL